MTQILRALAEYGPMTHTALAARLRLDPDYVEAVLEDAYEDETLGLTVNGGNVWAMNPDEVDE
jgi:hypothetical protein